MKKKGSLTVKQRRQQEQYVIALVQKLRQETGGRGKHWQAVKRLISVGNAALSAKGARKAALERKFDALTRKHSA